MAATIQTEGLPQTGGMTGPQEYSKRSMVTVVVPDMFASIMSPSPRVNLHYDKVKLEADAWAKDILRLDDRQHRRNSKANFVYLASLWVPEADEDGLRLVSDWLHWVFYFDDLFDDGNLKENPEQARLEVESTLALMTDSLPFVSKDEHPIRYMFLSTWKRIQARSSTELLQRYKTTMLNFCDGLLGQVNVRYSSVKLDLDGYMQFRRKSIGSYPCHQLVEFAHNINIPSHVLEHPSVKECETVCADLVLLQNDVLSYRKEQAMDVHHNIIILFRREGLSLQQAMNRIGELLNECYRRWYNALAVMPIYGEKVDKEVQKYIEGCRAIAMGNLNWSYMTGRYLGYEEGREVRETGLLKIMP